MTNKQIDKAIAELKKAKKQALKKIKNKKFGLKSYNKLFTCSEVSAKFQNRITDYEIQADMVIYLD